MIKLANDAGGVPAWSLCVVLRAVLSAMSSGVACIGSNPNAQDERMYE